jgi:hypothetical protein
MLEKGRKVINFSSSFHAQTDQGLDGLAGQSKPWYYNVKTGLLRHQNLLRYFQRWRVSLAMIGPYARPSCTSVVSAPTQRNP